MLKYYHILKLYGCVQCDVISKTQNTIHNFRLKQPTVVGTKLFIIVTKSSNFINEISNLIFETMLIIFNRIK